MEYFGNRKQKDTRRKEPTPARTRREVTFYYAVYRRTLDNVQETQRYLSILEVPLRMLEDTRTERETIR